MAETGKDIHKAKRLLEQGALVAIPTETVYGLAGNALDKDAVVKIFQAKARPHFDPLIVHVPSVAEARRYVENIPAPAAQLTEKFWPGPLTLLLKKKNIIPDLVTSGLDTVGIRCPNHPLTGALLKSLDFPLAAPSANPFGYVSPTTPQHVNEQLGDKIAYILDGGPCEVGIESTILGFEHHTPVIYRMGGLGLEDIERITGKVTIQAHSTSNPKAPGQLMSHYAPAKRVVLGNMETLVQQYPVHTTGLLTFQRDYHHPYQVILSPGASLDEAAQNLFAALRALDKMPVDVILTELVPDTGLGKAINDRLRRAAASQ
jgi:L-threonylcarbamoyladenylate synthase